MRILIVDDNPGDRVLIEQLLASDFPHAECLEITTLPELEAALKALLEQSKQQQAAEAEWRQMKLAAQDITARKQLEAEHLQTLAREHQARVQAEAAIQRLSAIQTIADAALATLNLDELLRELLVRICNVLGGDTATILLLQEDERHLAVRASHGLEEQAKDLRIPLGQGLVGRIAERNEALIVNDLPHLPAESGLLRRKTQSLLGVPLVAGAKVIGVIHVGTQSSQHFTKEDLGLLQVVAVRATAAIERAQLHEEVRVARDRLSTLSRQLMNAQETERRRIARELHDETGQALTAVKLNLQSLQSRSDDPQFRGRLNDSVGIVEQSLQQVRNLSHELRPSVLDDLGLVAALRWYIDRQAQRTGLAISFNAQTFTTRLSQEVETACFRIVQEALTNVIRHSHAAQAKVELSQDAASCRLNIEDDGLGFDVAQAHAQALQGGNLGLLGMQERAQLVGGSFALKSEPQSGTSINICFPFSASVTAEQASGQVSGLK